MNDGLQGKATRRGRRVSAGALFAFAVTSFLIVIVPGPTVTVIVANSLRAGLRAGLLNIAGTQAGLVPMILIVAAGLETVVALMAEWFVVVKLLGAAYLIWLGLKLWRSDGEVGSGEVPPPRIGYFWQGVLVIWSNPKALLLLGAIVPNFVDPAGSPFWQTILLGTVFMIIATVFDLGYALLAGRAGRLLTVGRVRTVGRISGTLLIGGGLWMAAMKRA